MCFYVVLETCVRQICVGTDNILLSDVLTQRHKSMSFRAAKAVQQRAHEGHSYR